MSRLVLFAVLVIVGGCCLGWGLSKTVDLRPDRPVQSQWEPREVYEARFSHWKERVAAYDAAQNEPARLPGGFLVFGGLATVVVGVVVLTYEGRRDA